MSKAAEEDQRGVSDSEHGDASPSYNPDTVHTPASALLEILSHVQDGDGVLVIHRKSDGNMAYVWSGMNIYEALGMVTAGAIWIKNDMGRKDEV